MNFYQSPFGLPLNNRFFIGVAIGIVLSSLLCAFLGIIA